MEKKEVLYPIGNATAIVEFSGSKSDTRVRKFWERVERGHWERSTLHVFYTVIDKETSVIDFGAWIGPTILFAGNFAKQVLGLEPNSRAYKVARRNVELNSLRFGKEKVQMYVHKCFFIFMRLFLYVVHVCADMDWVYFKAYTMLYHTLYYLYI